MLIKSGCGGVRRKKAFFLMRIVLGATARRRMVYSLSQLARGAASTLAA